MSTFTDYAKMEGIEIGERRGIEIGRNEGIAQAVIKAVGKGMSVEYIPQSRYVRFYRIKNNSLVCKP